MNWLKREAEKADIRKNFVILENPETIETLDNLLIEIFYPYIQNILEKTELSYIPLDKTEMNIISDYDRMGLGRSFVFILSDHRQYPILKGTVSCTTTGYFFERNFRIGLPENTEPEYIFKILNDPHFRGNMPTLETYKSEVRTDWDLFFHIDITAGEGQSCSLYEMRQVALYQIEDTINDSLEMHELCRDGFSSMEQVEDFLKIAYRCFEAC